MSDDHDHGGERFLCPGLPPPPSDDELATIETRQFIGMKLAAPADGVNVPHHWWAGPRDTTRMPRTRSYKTRDGSRLPCDWKIHWYLDRVEGVGVREAITRINDVLKDPRGWMRSGVKWSRTTDMAQADILVRVIPADQTVCGAGSAGCYSWGFDPSGKPVAEMGVEYINRDGVWDVITGMEMQGHGAFAIHDHYTSEHRGSYPCGAMGTWEAVACANYRPTNEEIEAARLWLEGKTPPELVHRHG